MACRSRRKASSFTGWTGSSKTFPDKAHRTAEGCDATCCQPGLVGVCGTSFTGSLLVGDSSSVACSRGRTASRTPRTLPTTRPSGWVGALLADPLELLATRRLDCEVARGDAKQ